MTPTWSDRWQRVKAELTVKDFLLDIAGKMLIGVGLGALCAETFRPYVWCLIGTGIILSALVKVKHWKRFWS